MEFGVGLFAPEAVTFRRAWRMFSEIELGGAEWVDRNHHHGLHGGVFRWWSGE
ncbi:hypothetical protein ACFYPT_42100 [Streptomyces sp. NPDC005529]|uniref:hypothetical protein n=1 Tax=unclassified Streptomyces TaxID=2593676 RepID=UPI0033A6293D